MTINALLTDQLWWKKVNEGDQDKIKRVQAARERSQRLKFGVVDREKGRDGIVNAPTVNSPGFNTGFDGSNGA